MPFVLQFWWSCPFCCVSLPVGGCVWHWSFVAGHCCWCLSLMPRAFSMLGCLLLLGHGVVALAFVLWGLSFGALGLLLSIPLGGCGCHLSNGPLRPLLMVGVAFCASGLLLLSIFFFFFSSFFLFLPVLAASSLSVCVLWSPSCFPCLGVWPSFVLGLVGPT